MSVPDSSDHLSPCDFLVLGAGVAGLTLALELTRRGRSVAVIEKADQVGGLARTLVFGDYRFDLGGHRFHSRWPHVTDWVRTLMDGNLLDVPRRSHIRLGNRYVEYPLQLPNAIKAFSLPQACHVLASYLHATLRRDRRQDASFEDWVVRRFGRALYEVYFRPYTEKVWGLPCAELSADWASQRISLPSLAAAVKDSLWPKASCAPTLVSHFLYPPLGIGMFTDRMAELSLATGRASLLLNSEVLALEKSATNHHWQARVRENGGERTMTAHQVISTIPVHSLLNALAPSRDTPSELGKRLTYRDLICVFLSLDGPSLSRDTWTYFPNREMCLGRTHEPRNWSVRMVPDGKTSLCVEIFCSRGDTLWTSENRVLMGRVIDELANLSLFRREQVLNAWLTREQNAYPIYRVGYADELARVGAYLARWPTLHLAGRTGSFQYMNLDAVMKQGLELAARLAGPPPCGLSSATEDGSAGGFALPPNG